MEYKEAMETAGLQSRVLEEIMHAGSSLVKPVSVLHLRWPNTVLARAFADAI